MTEQKTLNELCREIGEIEILGSELENAVIDGLLGRILAENEMRTLVGDAYQNHSAWSDLRNQKVQISPLRMSVATRKSLSQTFADRPEIASPLGRYQKIAKKPEALFDVILESEEDFADIFRLLCDEHSEPFLEFELDGRWYPGNFVSEMTATRFGKICHVFCRANVVDASYSVAFNVYPAEFVKNGASQVTTARRVVEKYGVRPIQTSLRQYWKKIESSAKLMDENRGKTYTVDSNVLMPMRARFESQQLSVEKFGSPDAPQKIVLDPDFEQMDEEFFSSESRLRNALPFVRGFSLSRKEYVYADLDAVRPYEFDRDAVDKLYLSDDRKKLLAGIFTSDTSTLFGDLVGGKSGGIVIMACGPPGVGKTLTAEVFAECTRRPLYCIEVSEIGTCAEEVEKNLALIFERATRWNAVLLFDECDVFLSKRRDDLERSAIVGIFLRLLDYFDGVLFMTTNRPEVLDAPVNSRVALRITYPKLDRAARAAVWKSMLDAAGLDAGVYLDEIAKLECDGRSIRNLVRVLDLLVEPLRPGGSRIVTPALVRQLAKHVPSVADSC